MTRRCVKERLIGAARYIINALSVVYKNKSHNILSAGKGKRKQRQPATTTLLTRLCLQQMYRRIGKMMQRVCAMATGKPKQVTIYIAIPVQMRERSLLLLLPRRMPTGHPPGYSHVNKSVPTDYAGII